MAKISQLLTINSQLFRIFARKCGMAACKPKNWCYFHEYIIRIIY